MTQAPRTPPARDPRRGAIRDAIVIAVLSILVAIGGGFMQPINLTIAILGGITSAVILYKELS